MKLMAQGPSKEQLIKDIVKGMVPYEMNLEEHSIEYLMDMITRQLDRTGQVVPTDDFTEKRYCFLSTTFIMVNIILTRKEFNPYGKSEN